MVTKDQLELLSVCVDFKIAQVQRSSKAAHNPKFKELYAEEVKLYRDALAAVAETVNAQAPAPSSRAIKA